MNNPSKNNKKICHFFFKIPKGCHVVGFAEWKPEYVVKDDDDIIEDKSTNKKETHHNK